MNEESENWATGWKRKEKNRAGRGLIPLKKGIGEGRGQSQGDREEDENNQYLKNIKDNEGRTPGGEKSVSNTPWAKTNRLFKH